MARAAPTSNVPDGRLLREIDELRAEIEEVRVLAAGFEARSRELQNEMAALREQISRFRVEREHHVKAERRSARRVRHVLRRPIHD